LRQFNLAQRFLQIDDVDAVAFRKNEAAHFGVPSTGLVPEVNARGEQLLEGSAGHDG
jgi:hypothetical protein